MSILNSLFVDIKSLIFPPLCPVCGNTMEDGSGSICTYCRVMAPITGFWNELDNPLSRRMWGLLPVVKASAFIYYVRGSGWQRLIHKLKYKGAWHLAQDMGTWYGSYLKRSEMYADIDVIVPIPLHIMRKLKRGYNQSDYIALGMAAEMEVAVDCTSVVRLRNNPSQTHRTKSERWQNVDDLFGVRNSTLLAGKHILLVDDVCTTGSTLISCVDAIFKAVPNCRISIAVVAVSQHEMGIDN